MNPIALTVGMGIGAEVTLKALPHFTHPTRLLARTGYLMQAIEQLGLDWSILWSNPMVQVVEFEDGEMAAEVQCIQAAAEGCSDGRFSAMVTGPINKDSLMSQGFTFPGHTDFLGHLCGGKQAVMAFQGVELKVVLVTTHIPLHQVPNALSTQRIVDTVKIAHQAWSEIGPAPRFAICGLNPHAGENGRLGREDLNIIQPACRLLKQHGIQVGTVVSAETAFMMARRQEVDVVVAMYHDQGLAPLKVLEFGQAVNWTQGLPIIRTSVDHGTADAIVGLGQAEESSMVAAWQLAYRIARSRHQPSQVGRETSAQTASAEVLSPTNV